VPIIDLQRRLAEKGRIRLGQKATTANGKTYPSKLDRLRFTSADKAVIDALAQRYGGTTGPWEQQWEVVTDTRVIDIMVIPAAMGFTQWLEDWSGGVCRKRCDGVTDHVRDVTCDCDPDNRTCKTTTRLSVMLPDLPGLGVWRLETHGYNAAVEIAAAVEMVELAAGAGAILPARLRLEDRTVKRLVDNKIETRNFVVPVVDLDVSARQLAGINGGSGPPSAVASGVGDAPSTPRGIGQSTSSRALPPGETPAGTPAYPTPPPPTGWRPVPEQAAAPLVSVADQLEEIGKPRKPRKNAATPIKPTGLAPRPAAANVCHLCAEQYGDAALVRNPAPEGNKYVHKTCADNMTEPAGGGDSTSSGPTAAEPVPAAPATSNIRAMSHEQHRKLMAVTADAFPIDPQTTTSDDAKAMRRANVIAVAAQLGITIGSRTDLDKRTGALVIDALEGIKAGTYRWVDDRLIEATTGDVVTVAMVRP
jgi:hypothetical protein